MAVDTLAYTRTLEAAGVPRVEAEAHAEALRAALATDVATRADLVRIEERLAAVERQMATKADLEGLRSAVALAATKADLAELKGQLQTLEQRLGENIQTLTASMKWPERMAWVFTAGMLAILLKEYWPVLRTLWTTTPSP